MHTRLARLLYLFALLLAIPFPGQGYADAAGETAVPAAPYFFIEGGDSGIDRLPLKRTAVDARLNGFLARVRLTQVYRNEGDRPLNATYVFPGSTRAAVNGMTMTVGERRIAARIREKAEARQTFDAARAAGKSASLLSQQRPNVFSMEVANILPGDTVTVELTYTELLDAEDGVYAFVAPGVVGPRYAGDAAHADGPTQWLRNPYLAAGTPDPVGYDIRVEMTAPLPISALDSPSHALATAWHDARSVSVSLRDATAAGNRDFILRYRLQDDTILTGLTRFAAGGEDWFMLVAEPPRRVVPDTLPARDYFFIVDVSGSMHGFPLETAKQLMGDLLRNLRPADRFNILFFAGGSEVLAPQPLPATPENIARAGAMLDARQGGGGTELYPALQRAFAMHGAGDASRNIVLITDGYISAEDRVFRLVDANLHRNNLFAFGIGTSVNRHLIEGIARAGRAEAFVVTGREEAARQAQRFNAYISAPVLTRIRLEASGVELYDLEPRNVPDLLAQRPLMVLGRYRNATADAAITLYGTGGQGEQHWTFALADAQASDDTLPQLWARKRLERLYVIPDTDADAQRAAILDLGLRYSLLTRHTSFVAVDETVRNTTGDAADVKQPLPLPQGVSNLAVGQPMPEPELVWLAGPALLVWLARRLRSGRRGRRA